MGSEMMDVEQLAAYLQRDVRELGKLASCGHLPGHKVGGEWRFARAEINQWLEGQLAGLSDQQLVQVERSARRDAPTAAEPLVSSLLTEASIAVPLQASTKSSVLRELVNLAEQTWQVYDPEAILDAIRTREELSSTALPQGVAIPHPRRPLPAALGESVLAYGRTASPLPFGAAMGGLTDIFFLVCCTDDRTHLRVLARLTRLLMRPGFLDQLREAQTPGETWTLLHTAEKALMVG
jgi:nitrogen PTS system EIIA component